MSCEPGTGQDLSRLSSRETKLCGTVRDKHAIFWNFENVKKNLPAKLRTASQNQFLWRNASIDGEVHVLSQSDHHNQSRAIPWFLYSWM